MFSHFKAFTIFNPFTKFKHCDMRLKYPTLDTNKDQH